MSSIQPTTKAQDHIGPLSAAEESKLDAAMRKADQILVASLKSDERRRHTRRLTLFLLGGLIMIAAGVVIVLSLLATNPSPQDVAKGENLSTEGWKLWQQRDLPGAEAKFQEAVKADPTSTTAWNGLGWSELNQGKQEDAEKTFTKCVELDPKQGGAQNGLGWISYGRKDYAKAEAAWKKANVPAAWNGLATMYLVQGKFDDALPWAQKLVNSGDTSSQRLLDAAKAKKLDDALRRELDPQATPKEQTPMNANTQQGWQFFNSGKPKQAQMAFEKALAENPNDFAANNGLGFVLINEGKTDEALAHFQKCLELQPDAAGPMNGLARCQKAQGKVDEAIATWKKMQELYPGPNAAMYGLAQTYFEQQKYSDALPLLKQLSEANPADEQVKSMLATAQK
ncbi:MAG TPA: tetratricopeptide repeat protein [Tepidisphaeraceae bacterium]|jgi:tetratricopeptide (TPR) repeat protein|nr:tetratricopeptide repeat protein [Tepidisphaeraceae bacterium]